MKGCLFDWLIIIILIGWIMLSWYIVGIESWIDCGGRSKTRYLSCCVGCECMRVRGAMELAFLSAASLTRTEWLEYIVKIEAYNHLINCLITSQHLFFFVHLLLFTAFSNKTRMEKMEECCHYNNNSFLTRCVLATECS